ncbi:MAG TPA: SpoIIE family protein phosphatase [Bacteroidia bacterium]|nr:SpoIIE family protein phosphatase [Bacteroidia bacterium]
MKALHKWFIGDYLAKTDDVFERARIELLYYYSLSFILLGGLFYVMLIVEQLRHHVYVTSFAVVALLSIPFLLKYTQNVKLAAWWYVFQQVIVAGGSIYLERGVMNSLGAYWTVLFTLCVLFLFNIKWGLILTVANGVLMGFIASYAQTHPTFAYEVIPDTPQYAMIPLLLNICVAIMFVKFRGDAGKQINLQKLELEVKNKEVKDSIAYAERIQKAILPSHRTVEYILPGSFVMYLPKDIVSGDFYWVEKKNDRVFFAVADCTGHGVPGAMMSVICQNALNRVLNEFNLTQPAAMLDKLNDLVEEAFAKSGADIRDGMDIALCSYSATSQTIEYAGANNALYYVNKGVPGEIKGDRQPIGRFESKVPFKNHEVKLNAGDFVYLFSDGIADQFGGPQGKKFKYKRVKEILLTNATKPVNDQKNELLTAFRAWKGNLEQVDDVCVLGVRIG